MSKITRFNGNLLAFGVNSTGTNRTVFGDTAQSDTLDDNINADFLTGWEIVGVNENPTREDFNAMGFTLGQMLAYLFQWGVPEWNTSQEFNNGSFTQVAGVLYESLTDSNTGNDPTTDDGTNWTYVIDNTVRAEPVSPDADTNYTLTRDEYTADRLNLVDGSWTQSHTILIPAAAGNRRYFVDNTAGTYDAAIGISGGASVTVPAGISRVVLADGTDVTDPLQSLGYGQTWQDVVGSRTLGVTYTNSTGRPIAVAVSMSDTGAGSAIVTVDGVQVHNQGNGLIYWFTVIVPAGSTYTASTGSGALIYWRELR